MLESEKPQLEMLRLLVRVSNDTNLKHVKKALTRAHQAILQDKNNLAIMFPLIMNAMREADKNSSTWMSFLLAMFSDALEHTRRYISYEWLDDTDNDYYHTASSASISGYMISHYRKGETHPAMEYFMQEDGYTVQDLIHRYTELITDDKAIDVSFCEVLSNGLLNYGDIEQHRMTPQECQRYLPIMPVGIKAEEEPQQVKESAILHSTVLSNTDTPSDCNGELMYLSTSFYGGHNWRHYVCMKCGKGIRAIHATSDLNSEFHLDFIKLAESIEE